MKKIITTASLAALGVASLQAAYAPGLSSTEASKPWSVSAILRGFYDDNYALRPSHDPSGADVKKDSFGFQVSPSVGVNLPLDQTFIGLSYTYDLRWYEARPNHKDDQTHLVNFRLDHAFSEHTRLNVADNFSDSERPQLGGVVTDPTVLRSRGNNLRNDGSIGLTTDLTRQFGIEAKYSNGYSDYDQQGAGSYSALLDRIENTGMFDLRWHALPETVAILGYTYAQVDHTSKDSIYTTSYVNPNTRDSRSHIFYVGAEQTLASGITANLKAGGQSTDYPNAVGSVDNNQITPYVDFSLRYAYATGSSATLGVAHKLNQTDLANTLDQETTSAYLSVNHRLTAKLTAMLTGQVQFSNANGGSIDGLNDSFYAFGFNLAYQIDPHWSADLGYNFDRLDSDLAARGYSQNRVYLGVRASY